ILWAWTAVLSIFVLLVTFGLHYSAFVPFGALFLVAVLYTVFLPGARVPAPLPQAVVPGADATEAGAGTAGAPPIAVLVSGAAGVAVAGEPDLTAPRSRRRRRVVRRALRSRGANTPPHPAPGIGTPPAHIVRPNDEMGG
ncbi:MAG: hypothetical protein ACLP81_02940, partial [Acidimicrobiales bacterium]